MGILNKKVRFLKLFLKHWVHVTGILFQTSISCLLLAASAEAERSFSLIRIKTYARSVMTEERYSDLALISMYYKEIVPIDEICKSCMPIPANSFKHLYLMIVVHIDLAILVIVI